MSPKFSLFRPHSLGCITVRITIVLPASDPENTELTHCVKTIDKYAREVLKKKYNYNAANLLLLELGKCCHQSVVRNRKS
jgi:hypothetical protein